MSFPSVISGGATRRRGRAAPPVVRTATCTLPVPEPTLERPRPHDLDAIAARWQLALDAAERALVAAGESLPVVELQRRRDTLVRERKQVGEMLVSLALVTGVRPPAVATSYVTLNLTG